MLTVSMVLISSDLDRTTSPELGPRSASVFCEFFMDFGIIESFDTTVWNPGREDCIEGAGTRTRNCRAKHLTDVVTTLN